MKKWTKEDFASALRSLATVVEQSDHLQVIQATFNRELVLDVEESNKTGFKCYDPETPTHVTLMFTI